MGSFFEELAKKVAERWLGLLTVPGLLFSLTVGIAVAAGRRGPLGQGGALDRTTIAKTVSTAAERFGDWGTLAQAMTLGALLLAATGVGLLVQALAPVIRRLWLGLWPWPFHGLGRWATIRRQQRYAALVTARRIAETNSDPAQQAEVDQLAARANRLAPALPGRPTWMGDRMQAVEAIAHNRYGLDLAFGWPRLRLVLPEPVAAAVGNALGQFAAATMIGSWAVPYLILGVFWFPALLVSGGIALAGWVRGRAAVAELGHLTESVLDLHGRALAVALGVGPPDAVGPLTMEEGTEITQIVRKGR
jgi:hypothetical protein